MSALRAELRPVGGIPHSRVENLLGLATGAVVVSLGLYLLNAVHAVTGGTAGLSLLLSYAADIPFEVLFVAVNIPFFLLAIAQKGIRFTLRSLACVVCVSLLATMHTRLVDLTAIERVYGVALGNLIPSEWGLGFAGVLCLVGILCSLANTPLRVLAAVVAGAAAVAAYALPLKLNIVAAIAVAVVLCFWLEGRVPKRPTGLPA